MIDARRATRRRLATAAGRIAAALIAGAGASAPVAAAGAPRRASEPGPYFSAPFEVDRNGHTFGQDPSWTNGGGVLSQELDRSGILQVYESRLDGSHRSCLTCGRTRGPNGFAAERPQGGWIMFCSYGDQPEHLGMPCLGGYGGDLYAMRTNGTDVTRLTRSSDPAGGAVYGDAGGVPYDNYHPYWSPNGRQIVWTRQEAYPLSQGGGRWQMLLGDFVAPRRGRPHLARVRVVGPAYGIYETQHWAPDGSGFLFTAFGPRRSPYQVIPAPGLYGHPIDMARVAVVRPRPGSAATARRQATVAAAWPPPIARSAKGGTFVGTLGADKQTTPAVVFSYLSLWLSQLRQLGDLSGTNIASVGFLGGA